MSTLYKQGRVQAGVGVFQDGAVPGLQTVQGDLEPEGGTANRSETERELMEALREAK